MATQDDLLARLGPNTLVDLQVSKADGLDEKDDLRRTRVLEVTDTFVILEQPSVRVSPKKAGRSMGITHVKRDRAGNLVREVLEAELVKVGDFELQEGRTEALFFAYPSNVYVTSVRRHFRVDIPLDEEVFVTLADLEGKLIGSPHGYRVVDLSLQGLRFVCEGGRGPVVLLSEGDEVLTKLMIGREEVLGARSAVRARLASKERRDILCFGVEFLQRVCVNTLKNRIEFEQFTDKDQRCLSQYITQLQRKALRKDGGS